MSLCTSLKGIYRALVPSFPTKNHGVDVAALLQLLLLFPFEFCCCQRRHDKLKLKEKC